MNTRQQRQMARAEREAAEFNAKYPPGTPVLFHKVIGRPETAVETKTRSVAWALPSGEPVVSVEGRAGGCSLEAIKVLATTPAVDPT
jgi:hypothetical protein